MKCILLAHFKHDTQNWVQYSEGAPSLEVPRGNPWSPSNEAHSMEEVHDLGCTLESCRALKNLDAQAAPYGDEIHASVFFLELK